MSDAESAISTSRATTLAPSDAPERSISPSVPSNTVETPSSTTQFDTPREHPATPKQGEVHEHDDDIPMMDISPRNQSAIEVREPEPPDNWRLDAPPSFSTATLVEPVISSEHDLEDVPFSHIEEDRKKAIS